MKQNDQITVLKSIIYDTNNRLKITNNKISLSKLIYIYLFNLRLANNKKLPKKRNIAQKLNIDYRTIQPNLDLLISSGFLSIKNDTYEIYFENQTTKDMQIVDNPEIFSKEYNKQYNRYEYDFGYYVKAPQKIIFSNELSANEKIYYLIFLDYFMREGKLNAPYYQICHLSKLIKEKDLARKTVYENFNKLREKRFLKCDLIVYGSRANEKGFKNLCFFEESYKEDYAEISNNLILPEKKNTEQGEADLLAFIKESGI